MRIVALGLIALERQSSLGEVIPGVHPTWMSYLYNICLYIGGIPVWGSGLLYHVHMYCQNLDAEMVMVYEIPKSKFMIIDLVASIGALNILALFEFSCL